MSGKEVPPSAVPKSAIANGVLLAVPATSRAESTLDSAACTKGWQRAITSKQPLVAAVYVPLPRPPHGTCLPEASTVASPRRKYVVATPAGRGDASTARRCILAALVGDAAQVGCARVSRVGRARSARIAWRPDGRRRFGEKDLLFHMCRPPLMPVLMRLIAPRDETRGSQRVMRKKRDVVCWLH